MQCHKSQSIRASVGPMTFAYTCSYSREDIGAFGPTAEQRRDQSQRDCLHGMKDSVDLDEKKAHGGAAALFSLATLSAAADPLPVSTPCYPSSWASSLVAANHGTFLEGDWCPLFPNLPPLCLVCTHSPDLSATYTIPRLVRGLVHGSVRVRHTPHDVSFSSFHFSSSRRHYVFGHQHSDKCFYDIVSKKNIYTGISRPESHTSVYMRTSYMQRIYS